MKLIWIVSITFFCNAVFALSAIDQAVTDAGIKQNDSLEVKIDKALWLLNENRYFYPKEPIQKLPAPFDEPYHLDSLRTPEQILGQKIGGSCGSSALAFAAILKSSGVDQKNIQIVNAVVNDSLKIICPTAKKPRVLNAKTGAQGHVFVALRFSDGKWKIIDPVGGSRNYARADWFSPDEVKNRIKTEAIPVPAAAFKNLPTETYSSGLTVFQSWFLNEVSLHTFEQRYDLIAAGDSKKSPSICRFTAPSRSADSE